METHAQNIAGKSGFDVTTIIAVIEAILTALGPILANCGKPVPPAKEALAQGDSFAGTLAIYRGMRANDIRPLSREGRLLHAALIEEGKTLDDDEAKTFMALAQ